MNHETTLKNLSTLAFCALGILSGCGVKAAPTPILDTPPTLLQQEVNRRADERKETNKQKMKDKKARE